MPSDAVTPALSAAEWQEIAEDKSWWAERLHEEVQSFSANFADFNQHRPHALAALALYQQPFGFTREDVKLLREIAGLIPSVQGELDVLSVASRLAALLPPEDAG